MKKHLVAFSLLAVLGAGCPRTPDMPIAIPPIPSPQKTAPTNGFGMLPPLGAPSAVLGTPEAISARPSAAPSVAIHGMGNMAVAVEAPTIDAATPMPMNVGGGSTGSAGSVKLIARPIPAPQPAKVTYKVNASLPSWGADSDVLRGKDVSLPTTGLKGLALATGLPSQALGDTPSLKSFNVTWKDADNLTWSFDSMGRSLSFWMENNYAVMDAAEGTKIQRPTLSDEEVLSIANDFMTRHGLSNFSKGSPTVDHPWGAGDAVAPCPMPLEKEAAANAAGTTDAKMMIMPCGGYYPVTTSVTYPLVLDGQAVYDAWGSPTAGISLQVDFAKKQVTNGYIWLTPDTDRSKYPLINAEEATKRLMAGGRNPIYWYGEESQNITATIEKVELVWMRYDSWTQDGGTKTFFLPAIYGSGTQTDGKDMKQEYRTVVPLVADEAFGGATPPPVIMPMVDPAALDVAPTPAVAPKTR